MVKKEKKEDLFFVGINDPISLRREILLSTKDSIQFLKKNEELKDLRIQKIEKIMQFKNDMKEINALINKLKERLPKAKLRIREKPLLRTELKKKKRREIIKKKKIHPISDLEKLEMELGDIEKKLGRLR